MPRNIITALDVGTSTVQTVVAGKERRDGVLKILGMGVVPSIGMRKGTVIDIGDVMSSIHSSLEEARKSAGVNVKSVWLALGGSPISVFYSRGVVAVSRADGEISPEDVRRAIAAAGTFIPKNPNKEVLHMIPRDFRVDEERGIKDPIGMHGVRLEADTLIIEHASLALKNLFKCVEGAGARIEDYVFGPLAAAGAVLTKRQKELGAMLVDIGGGSASFIVYEEGVPIHAGVIPIGGGHITNDLAIGFRTQVDVAEQVKLTYGSCLPAEISRREQVRLAELLEDFGGKVEKAGTPVYSRRELAEIIGARLRDIFELLQKELKKIGRAELLPAGVLLVGGSAQLPGLAEFARQELRLPAEIGYPYEFLEDLGEDQAPALAASLGVLKWVESGQSTTRSWGSRFSRGSANPWTRWLKSLLP